MGLKHSKVKPVYGFSTYKFEAGKRWYQENTPGPDGASNIHTKGAVDIRFGTKNSKYLGSHWM